MFTTGRPEPVPAPRRLHRDLEWGQGVDRRSLGHVPSGWRSSCGRDFQQWNETATLQFDLVWLDPSVREFACDRNRCGSDGEVAAALAS